MPSQAKKTCYYELLGLDRKCEPADIKSTYRKLALRMHPDKAAQNNLSVEEATRMFQEIQEAYSVLSDPQERAWYDSHREQILRGQDDGEAAEDPFKTRINLYKYFSASCYSGYSDDENGFFAVYNDLFAAIDAEEEEWEDLDSDEDHVAMPPFGRSDAEYADVSSFYRHWLEFVSRKAFAHADKWNPKEAPNRQIRRAMETENKQARKAAKKEFNAEVRQLVKFVQKRDPRVIAHQKQQMKENAEKAQRESAEREQRKVTEAHERKERQEAARQAEEARWAEVRAAKAERKARGEVVSEDDDEDSNSEEEEVYVCEACNKKFKSEKAYDQHAKSKKHLQVVEALRRELEREMKAERKALEAAEKAAAAKRAAEKAAAGESSEEDSDEESEAKDSTKATKANAKAAEGESDEGEASDEESDEDAFLARFASSKKGAGGGGGFAPPPRGGAPAAVPADEAKPTAAAAEGSDSDDDTRKRPNKAGSIAAEEGASKRAQKKAQQKAVLLERQATKEKVEDLVRQVRKGGTVGEPAQADPDQGEAAAAAASTKAKGKATKASTTAGDGASCEVCGEEFPSRTQLFKHIKVTGHAALKPMDDEAAASSRGKKKKR